MPTSLAATAPLSERFLDALDKVQDKLVHLAASTPLLLVALLIVLAAIWLGGIVSRRMRVLRRISGSNPYMDGLLRGVVRSLIVLAGVLTALDLLGATSLVGAVLGSAGVVGLVLGFAFKDIAENYVAGVLLSLRQPFAPGDSVTIDDYSGSVIALTSRVTVLMTADGCNLQLPNSLVFKSVLLNVSRNPQRRFDFQLGVGHAASLHAAMDRGIAALAAVPGVLEQPAPNALVQSVGTDGVVLQFTAWIDQSRNDLGRTRSEAIRAVRRTLWEAGIPPAEPSSRIVLVRAEGTADLPPDANLPRDTSVDHALDEQIGHARRCEEDADLLSPAPAARPDDARGA